MRRVLPSLLLLVACTADTAGLLGDTGGDDEIPTGEDALAPWLADGAYQNWVAEPDPHASAGPHFGDVRTFFSPSLVMSLEAGDPTHPVGAAAVKELFGSGTTVLGHSVMIKIADGPGGDTWYWYEHFDGSTLVDAVGTSVCTDCHGAGQDFVRTPLP